MNVTGNWKTKKVFIDDELLSPKQSQEIWNHSPTGFNWGYAGSGPAQLALALMLRFTANVEKSEKLYQIFKFEFIATLPQTDFSIPIEEIKKWIKSKEKII